MLIETDEGVVLESNGENTILECALNKNIIFEYSCKNGQCGVCKTALKKGSVKEIIPQFALNDQDRESGKFLTCCCAPVGDILIDAKNLSVLQGIKNQVSPARISKLELVSKNIIKVDIRLPPSVSFNFLEGQYLDVIGPNSVRRSYSIASVASKKEITLLIKKVQSGTFSKYWFESAKKNDLLRIEGPKGTFFIRNKEKRLLFLATGTGIAPIIAMLNQLDNDDSFIQGNPIDLYWGNRKKSDFFWTPEFKKLKVKVNFVLSQHSDHWDGKEGYIQDHVLKNITGFEKLDVYACGSHAMIKSAQKIFVERGLPLSNFYSDAFLQTF